MREHLAGIALAFVRKMCLVLCDSFFVHISGYTAVFYRGKITKQNCSNCSTIAYLLYIIPKNNETICASHLRHTPIHLANSTFKIRSIFLKIVSIINSETENDDREMLGYVRIYYKKMLNITFFM